VTVAVLPEPTEVELPRIPDRELDWSVCRGTGAGGQKRNKTETTVQLKHLPTGLQVRCEDTRSQQKNRALALQLLRSKLWERKQLESAQNRAKDRRQQVGLGERGSKRRTIRVQDGVVTDHILGIRWELKRYLRGEWD
jgi:peptide chain release factor 1